ncbi:hypothetical protein DFS33DRAFT_1329604 [Desarmillaria ectypa]|nr:hypothetical protein DFS33DRAFT_1329604 [Desarmillaria ectypa]
MSLLSLSSRCRNFGVGIPLRAQLCLPLRYMQTGSIPKKSPARKKSGKTIPRKVVLGEAWARRLVLYHGNLPYNQETISVFHTLTTYNPFFLLPESKCVDPFIAMDKTRSTVKPYNFVLETVPFPTRDDIQTICEYTAQPFQSLVQKTGTFATHSLDAFLEHYCREPERTRLPFMVDHMKKEVIFSGTRIAQWVHQEIIAAGKRETLSLERLRVTLREALRVNSAERLQQEVHFREEMWEKVYQPYEMLRKAQRKMTEDKRKQKQEMAVFPVRFIGQK